MDEDASKKKRKESDDPEIILLARKGKEKKIKKLLEKSAVHVDEAGRSSKTALQVACEVGNFDVVHLLLKGNANPNLKDDNNCTALHYAVQNGHIMITKLLLSFDARHDVQNAQGNTPLHLAANGSVMYETPSKGDFHYLAMLNLLIEHSAAVNAKNKDGDSPLHIATSYGRDVGVLFLLRSRAEINSVNNKNETALFIAAKKGFRSTVEILLKLKTDTTIKDSTGSTCADVTKDEKIRDLLKGKSFTGLGALLENEYLIIEFHKWSRSTQFRLYEIDTSSKSKKRLSRVLNSKAGEKEVEISEPHSVTSHLHVDEKLNWTCDDGANPSSYFIIHERLGTGASAKVYKGQHRITGFILAIKVIEADSLDAEKQAAISREIDIMLHLKNPNIVQYFGCYFEPDSVSILMEYCGLGSALDVRRILGSFNERQVAALVYHVCQGLVYLHSKKVIHRDLKAQNILLNNDGFPKIADFGVSAQLTEFVSKAKTFIGTPQFMAPEILGGNEYSYASDVWSLGITTIQLVDGVPPHFSTSPLQVITKIVNSDPPTVRFPQKWSSTLNNFLHSCLEKDPKLRMSALQVLEHPFLKVGEKAEPIHLLAFQEMITQHAEAKQSLLDQLKQQRHAATVQFNEEMALVKGTPKKPKAAPADPTKISLKTKSSGNLSNAMNQAPSLSPSKPEPEPVLKKKSKTYIGFESLRKRSQTSETKLTPTKINPLTPASPPNLQMLRNIDEKNSPAGPKAPSTPQPRLFPFFRGNPEPGEKKSRPKSLSVETSSFLSSLTKEKKIERQLSSGVSGSIHAHSQQIHEQSSLLEFLKSHSKDPIKSPSQETTELLTPQPSFEAIEPVVLVEENPVAELLTPAGSNSDPSLNSLEVPMVTPMSSSLPEKHLINDLTFQESRSFSTGSLSVGSINDANSDIITPTTGVISTINQNNTVIDTNNQNHDSDNRNMLSMLLNDQELLDALFSKEKQESYKNYELKLSPRSFMRMEEEANKKALKLDDIDWIDAARKWEKENEGPKTPIRHDDDEDDDDEDDEEAVHEKDKEAEKNREGKTSLDLEKKQNTSEGDVLKVKEIKINQDTDAENKPKEGKEKEKEEKREKETEKKREKEKREKKDDDSTEKDEKKEHEKRDKRDKEKYKDREKLKEREKEIEEKDKDAEKKQKREKERDTKGSRIKKEKEGELKVEDRKGSRAKRAESDNKGELKRERRPSFNKEKVKDTNESMTEKTEKNEQPVVPKVEEKDSQTQSQEPQSPQVVLSVELTEASNPPEQQKQGVCKVEEIEMVAEYKQPQVENKITEEDLAEDSLNQNQTEPTEDTIHIHHTECSHELSELPEDAEIVEEVEIIEEVEVESGDEEVKEGEKVEEQMKKLTEKERDFLVARQKEHEKTHGSDSETERRIIRTVRKEVSYLRKRPVGVKEIVKKIETEIEKMVTPPVVTLVKAPKDRSRPKTSPTLNASPKKITTFRRIIQPSAIRGLSSKNQKNTSTPVPSSLLSFSSPSPLQRSLSSSSSLASTEAHQLQRSSSSTSKQLFASVTSLTPPSSPMIPAAPTSSPTSSPSSSTSSSTSLSSIEFHALPPPIVDHASSTESLQEKLARAETKVQILQQQLLESEERHNSLNKFTTSILSSLASLGIHLDPSNTDVDMHSILLALQPKT